jgi:hypothetical protein
VCSKRETNGGTRKIGILKGIGGGCIAQTTVKTNLQDIEHILRLTILYYFTESKINEAPYKNIIKWKELKIPNTTIMSC